MTTSRPCVSLPTPLLLAYRRARATPAGRTLPPLSHLLAREMQVELLARGIPVPEAAPPARTAAATRARWTRKDQPR